MHVSKPQIEVMIKPRNVRAIRPHANKSTDSSVTRAN